MAESECDHVRVCGNCWEGGEASVTTASMHLSMHTCNVSVCTLQNADRVLVVWVWAGVAGMLGAHVHVLVQYR